MMRFKWFPLGLAAAALLTGCLYMEIIPAPAGVSATTVPSTPVRGTNEWLHMFVATANPLAYAVSEMAPVVIGDRVYLIGGTPGVTIGSPDYAAATKSIQTATFDAQDNLGPWTTLPGTLVTARVGATTAVIGSYLYVFGGGNATTGLTSIERAPINNDGTLGAFATVAGTTLATGRINHTSFVSDAYVYHLGGNFAPTNTVERAAINGDGSLGSFSLVASSDLKVERWTHGGAKIGNYYYVFGGEKTGGSVSSIEYAPIHSDGSLGAFQTATGSLSTPRNTCQPVKLQNRIYVMGGWSGTFLKTLDSAPIRSDGKLGAFALYPATDSVLTSGLAAGVTVVRPKAAFYLGGENGTAAVTTVQRAPIE